MKFDLQISNAQIIDGTGSPSYKADIAISGDRIVSMRDMKGEAKKTIDATNFTVMPGIIDPHSHADLILPLPPPQQIELMRCKLAQGITTTIIGNCGLGCAPVADLESKNILRSINAWMTPEFVEWDWQTTGEYLGILESNGLPLNIATLAPHGPIRISVMGMSKGQPSKSQLIRMQRMLDQSMQDGALGLSTGLIYPPGMYSDPHELTALARVAADYGGIYTSHIRGSSELLIPAVNELIDIGKSTGIRIHHSHNEAVGKSHWEKIDEVLAIEEQAEREGIRISFDMFPYHAAATMMIAIYPPWALEGGIDQLIERLKDKPTRNKIEHDIKTKIPSWPPWHHDGWPHNLVSATGWNAIYIGYVESNSNKKYEKCSLSKLAELTHKTPFDAISDLIIEENGQVSMLIFEISGENDDFHLLSKYAQHKLCAFCTDAEDYGRGLPHPAAYGAFPRILSKFIRNDAYLTIEEAVRKMTSYPAQIFGLTDRGVIKVGAYADIAIINTSEITDNADYFSPTQFPQGVKYTIVNGEIAYEDLSRTYSRVGKIIRKNF